MNFDYYFKLSTVAQAVEIMLREEYGTEFFTNQVTRDRQFEAYYGLAK
jgi:hypothetical protein